jgi:hypothetical protein
MDKKCKWVRARLALWVGDHSSSDLAVEDRLPVEEHLRACNDCRHHRASLESALNTLWASSEQLLIDPDAPSLWPLLKQRLADYPLSGPSTQAHAERSSICRPHTLWTSLDDAHSLRYAWSQDSLREVFSNAQSACLRSGSRFAVLGMISVVAVCLLLIAQFVLQNEWKSAGHPIHSNMAPLAADQIDSPRDQREETPAAGDAFDMTIAPPNAVAEVDLSHAFDPSGSGLDAAPSAKSAPKNRWSYDLENGIPSFPSDARESKPVY